MMKINGIQVARGVRNSVGFDWHPQTNKMYFGDNGRDWLGDDSPSCELNILENENSFFGLSLFYILLMLLTHNTVMKYQN
jgi:glucose/arabinose dehydrogenase